MITRTFKLCLNAGTGSAPYINVNQYDEGETWLFELYTEQGERYLPTTGAIVGVKSDGHGIANTGTVDSNGRVVINETQQMTASAGRAIFELNIDGLTHGTANFIVAVERKPTDEAVMSDSDLSLIQEAIDSAEVIVEVIGDGDPSEVIGEHVDAWLDNHPEATTTVQDGAITAPKLNNSLWDKLLVNESASGAVASFDDGADDVPVSSLKVALEPIQLGSGDPSPTNIRPIVASNGKNVLPLSLANMKSINTSGTWSGNAYTLYGVTYTVNTGEDDTVASITVNGTASQYTLFRLVNAFTASEAMILSGSPTGSSTSGYRMQAEGDSTIQDNGNGANIPAGYSATRIIIVVPSGVSVNNAVFKPMIRPVSITDSSYQPYQGIMVEKTGKNLWKFNNSYTLSAAGSWLAVDASRSFPLKAGTYTWSFTALQAIDTIQMYFRTANDVSKTVSFYVGTSTGTGRKSYTFTLDEDVAILRSAYCNGAMSIEEIQIERGSEATEYEPYIGTSYPYTLGQSVYGGTVDLATGVLTVDMGYFTLNGSETWGVENNGARVVTADLRGQIKTNTDNNSMVEGDITNMFLQTTPNRSYVGNIGFSVATDGKVQVSDGSHSMTVAGWKSFLASKPLTLAMKLDTPTTVQLTPQEVKTLLGCNNISSSGTVDVIYHADTKLYVDKMTAVDNNIIAPTEADFVATRNYTVNDLVIVNDTLYKVTANIATGSAITPNSNVTQTTLSALIKALS